MAEEKKELKIALIGSAPSSIRLAPFGDPSWQVWGCSPGAYGVIPRGRSNIWFELHRVEPGQPWFSPEYCQFLRDHPRVMVAQEVPEIPNGEVMPVDELLAKYSPYFFTSSLAWMMALAIEAGATKIGLWGVDMAAGEEYGYQRAGCQFFALLAKSKGIEVGVPPESDLFRPNVLYGIDEVTHGAIKTLQRKRELDARLANAKNNLANANSEVMFLQGALDDLNYMGMTWLDKRPFVTPPTIAMPSLMPQLADPNAAPTIAPADGAVEGGGGSEAQVIQFKAGD